MSESPDSPATADVIDEHGDAVDVLALQLRDVGGHARFHGLARTIHCLHDNGLIKATLATPGEGAVLVIDGEGSLQTALMGDLIATSAVENGWAGVIIHGAVRDSVALGSMPLGVKALGFTPRKSAKTGAGELDITLDIAGTRITPGMTVWADPDGVVIGP